MIYLFNESDTASWELTEKNEYFYHLGVKGTKFGIDILKRDISGFDFFSGALETMKAHSSKFVITTNLDYLS